MYNVELQHSKKKYHAIERIRLLLDKDSFHELGADISNYLYRNDDTRAMVPYDGVITGYGTIGGRIVYVFSQDFTVRAGTIGRKHGEKIAKIIEQAMLAKAPLVGVYDSGGARIDEGINALAGCGAMLHNNSLASGYIPQISVVVGPCAGAASYSPALSDFVFMVKPIGNMFITGRDVVKSVTGCDYTQEELGGAVMHSTKSGVAHFCYNNEKQCFAAVRKLLKFLPASCDDRQEPQKPWQFVPGERSAENIIPEEPQRAYDVKRLVRAVLDDDSFIEVSERFAASMVVGFGRLSDRKVGIVANQPLCDCGAIDCDSSDKAARFIRFCDAFNIPILTFVDTPGYLPGIDQEQNGILRHGAKLLYAYSEATVPKLTVVLRKAYGGAYIAMGSKHLGADRVYALPKAEIAVMGAEGAASIIYKKEIRAIADESERSRYQAGKVLEYKEQYLNASVALHEGFVDEVLQPNALRKRLYDDLRSLERKQPALQIQKKHGNIPL